MKKSLIILLSFTLFLNGYTKAEVLNVPQVIQEQSQWCWAGVSKCILDYFGYPNQQCTIAEYARKNITWTDFGSADCCVDPNQGCNYWNYIFETPGSIQDILIHFGNIQSEGVRGTLTLDEVNTEIKGGRPFVVRWEWLNGDGHFVVGHGLNGNNVYYMDPWFNEGLHISNYRWLVNDGNHKWTHTNVLKSSPTGFNNLSLQTGNIIFYPNPAKDKITFDISKNELPIHLKLSFINILGKKVKEISINSAITDIQLDGFISGIYFFQLQNEEKTLKTGKIIIQ